MTFLKLWNCTALPGGIARRLVFDGLTSLDVGGVVRPALAMEWASADADHRWQFHLRPGVHFHDGTPLTSVNVVASLNTACPANCPWSAVRALGAWLVFTSDAPMPNLPALFASDEFRRAFLAGLGAAPSALAYEASIDDTLDRLADHLAAHLDLDAILAAARPPRLTKAA